MTSIDYAKAFNRLSFQECLAALARKGASSNLLAIIASFLSNRTMSVRVDESWSNPLPVFGGVPQGSILGVFLFNATTDNLEDGTGVDDQSEPVEQASYFSSSEEEVQSPPGTHPRASTPNGGQPPLDDSSSPVLPPGYVPNETFVFLKNARNTHRFRPMNRVVYSSEGELTLPEEPNPVT